MYDEILYAFHHNDPFNCCLIDDVDSETGNIITVLKYDEESVIVQVANGKTHVIDYEIISNVEFFALDETKFTKLIRKLSLGRKES